MTCSGMHTDRTLAPKGCMGPGLGGERGWPRSERPTRTLQSRLFFLKGCLKCSWTCSFFTSAITSRFKVVRTSDVLEKLPERSGATEYVVGLLSMLLFLQRKRPRLCCCVRVQSYLPLLLVRLLLFSRTTFTGKITRGRRLWGTPVKQPVGSRATRCTWSTSAGIQPRRSGLPSFPGGDGAG